jgi:anti-sigma regulatory factor (Ser/Thr protein kinase)
VTSVDEDHRSLVMTVSIEPIITTSAVREQIVTTLGDLGEDHRHDVLLVVTELVNNVLDHAGGTGQLRLRRSRVPCEIWIEVDDTSPSQPTQGRSRLSDTRGRGIVIVDNLSREWGTRPLPDGGKTVYALICCDGDQALKPAP